MKRSLLTTMLACGLFSLKAQVFLPAVVNNAGGEGALGGVRIEWSVGENFVQTLPGNSIFTLGVLQPHNSMSIISLPVTGLQFQARRSSADRVQLDWSTLQEMNNAGFTIERKRENEPGFIAVGFVRPLSPDGNSATPLSYSKIDTNAYVGRTYYRLKQQDIDGRFTYSVIRLVDGDGLKAVSLRAWPVPSAGKLNIVLEGAKQDIVQVVDMNGRLLRQYPLQESTPLQLNGLSTGTYLLRLASHPSIVQKIIIQ